MHASTGGSVTRADSGEEAGKSCWAADAPVPSPKLLVAALLAGWRARVDAVLKARRAYAVALHLAPGAAGAWGDLALAYFAEGQLRRAHGRFEAQQAPALRSKAERLLQGEVFCSKQQHYFALASVPIRSTLPCCKVT